MRARDDVDRLLSRRRARTAGAGPQPAARALVRAGGDRGRRQPGDQRRARLRRAQARRRVLHRARGRRRSGSTAIAPPGSSSPTARPSAADVVVSGLGVPQTVLRLLDGARDRRAPAPPDPQHPLRPRPAALGQPTRCTSRRAYSLPRPTRASARSRACTGARRIPTTWRRATRPRSTSTASRSGRSCSARSTRLWDPTRAPEGKHLVGVEEFAAPRRLFSPEHGRRSRRASPITCSTQWQRYAPNMTRDNVIADARLRARRHRGQAPRHDRGRLLGRAARSPRSSAASGPCPSCRATGCCWTTSTTARPTCTRAPGIGRGSSFNCFNAIAADLGLADAAPARRAGLTGARARHRGGARASAARSSSRSRGRGARSWPPTWTTRARGDGVPALGTAARPSATVTRSRGRRARRPWRRRCARFGGLDGLVNNAGIVDGHARAGERDPGGGVGPRDGRQREGHLADDAARRSRRSPARAAAAS